MARGAWSSGRATPTCGRAASRPCASAKRSRAGARARSTLRCVRASIDPRSFIHDVSRMYENLTQARSRPAHHRFVRGRCRNLFQPGRPGPARSRSRRGAGRLPRRPYDARQEGHEVCQSARRRPHGRRVLGEVGHAVAANRVTSVARAAAVATRRRQVAVRRATTAKPNQVAPSRRRIRTARLRIPRAPAPRPRTGRSRDARWRPAAGPHP